MLDTSTAIAIRFKFVCQVEASKTCGIISSEPGDPGAPLQPRLGCFFSVIEGFDRAPCDNEL